MAFQLLGARDRATLSLPIANGVTLYPGEIAKFSSNRADKAATNGADWIGLVVIGGTGNAGGTVFAQIVPFLEGDILRAPWPTAAAVGDTLDLATSALALTTSANGDFMLLDTETDIGGTVYWFISIAPSRALVHQFPASCVASGTLAYARMPVGVIANTVAAGDDARMTDARTPVAHNHAAADVNAGTLDYARMPVGVVANTVAAGDDARMTDARTPVAHNHDAANINAGTVAVARLPAKAGTVTLTGADVAATITFATAFATANYRVSATQRNPTGAAVGYEAVWITNQLAASFVANIHTAAGGAFTVEIDWIAYPDNDP